MPNTRLLPTVVHDVHRRLPWTTAVRHGESLSRASLHTEDDPGYDPEYKLPKRSSLIIVLMANTLLQISFFVVVSSSSAYAEHLGGSATFSGLVIGIPTVFSGLALIPLMYFDQGGYRRPLHVACASAILGHILYGLAYHFNYLYLILISRIVSGFSFTFWMYCKRYCSDSRIVGIRRRTMLAGWLVVGVGCGLTVGPFLGGILFNVGFGNTVFNGFTAPGWIMAGIWAAFWAAVVLLYEDVPKEEPPAISLAPLGDTSSLPPLPPSRASSNSTSLPTLPSTSSVLVEGGDASRRLTLRQWAVCVCMCWYAMTCFFNLGCWEANIPVFSASSASSFHWSPFRAGNFIALGGLTTFPFLFANVYFARRMQDRHILAIGTILGSAGLFAMLGILRTGMIDFGSYFACWFLVALGFNIASTVTVSLLSKQLPNSWNSSTSMAIQYSNYLGRVTGAVWGGAGVHTGMLNYVGVEIVIVGVGGMMLLLLYKELKTKSG